LEHEEERPEEEPPEPPPRAHPEVREEQEEEKYKKSRNKRAVLRQFRDSLFIPIDTVQLSYGSADAALENAAYEIDKDSLSKPVESKVYGWVMTRLLKNSKKPPSLGQ